ncbi:hypothetical protein [Roseovarius amoyensis]|uniref:hypothetical protein n=1 Tax=Roseovarius amoyensis TaxID=2211448 RepID=UPI000DBE76B2|nr:hypothetical protein [Roseovarius amoyensis]
MAAALRILQGLERSPATGDEAEGMARLGFLEWMFALEGDSAVPEHARVALHSDAARAAESAAARAFVGFLRQATWPLPPAPVRQRRRRALN